MVIGSFMDLRIIEPIFCFLSPKGKVKNVNSILEPYATHKKSLSFYEAQTGEVILEAEELLKLHETITRVYVQRTGKPIWVVSEDMERDVFMSATEAQAHAIVDLVAVQ
ncbi:hypothetical protein Bca4012_044334 [Brassica carinata]